MNGFGDKLKAWRESRGLTQDAAGAFIGADGTTWPTNTDDEATR